MLSLLIPTHFRHIMYMRMSHMNTSTVFVLLCESFKVIIYNILQYDVIYVYIILYIYNKL